MDRHIAALPAELDGDLMLCRAHGVAYQHDRTNLVSYDAHYYDKCASYEGQEIAKAINAGRVAFVRKHFGDRPVVDVGIGSGEFIRTRGLDKTWGHDINPAGIEWLKRNDRWAEMLDFFGAATFWDVIEHVDTPEQYLKQCHHLAFFSLPIFQDLDSIRSSRHYRPNEHLQHFTAAGFIAWMDRHGFCHVETTDFETRAGRDSILSFVFRRYRSVEPAVPLQSPPRSTVPSLE